MAESGQATIARAAASAGSYRWVIVGLLFLATVINYIDRQMLGVLKPTLVAELHWDEREFAEIVIWFQLAYAIGYIGFGRLVDVIGARLGYAVAFVLWTIAHIAHGGVHTIAQFAAVRFGLGIGESGNFPAGIKAVTEWFPARERAFATGVFNAGANIGAIVTPLVVPWLTVLYGWRAAFVITGLATSVWVIAWLVVYRRPAEHKRVSAEELAWIQKDPPDPVTPLPWLKVLFTRETWAYALGKFCIDPVW
jgi:ACS family hexuronate transporter-like MFS transporter